MCVGIVMTSIQMNNKKQLLSYKLYYNDKHKQLDNKKNTEHISK